MSYTYFKSCKSVISYSPTHRTMMRTIYEYTVMMTVMLVTAIDLRDGDDNHHDDHVNHYNLDCHHDNLYDHDDHDQHDYLHHHQGGMLT